MHKALFLLALAVLVPGAARAATTQASFSAAQSLLVASSSPGNAYAAGASVVLTAPVQGDLSVAGGSIIVAAPVSGDDSLLGGTVSSRARVAGDLRVLAGSVGITEPIGGDLLALGWSVSALAPAGGSVFIGAWNVKMTAGASGPVTIYGNNVSLGGTFGGDVRVVSSGHLTLAPNAHIRGALSYSAPEPAVVPASVTIDGGVTYTSASYLPNPGTSRILALVSIGFFLFVRILGALILAGLLAGLFPRLAEAVVTRAHAERIRDILLSMLLGFGILVATPILLVILLLTFVGIGLALLLLAAYALLVLLSLMYAGILVGGIIARRSAGRETVLWHDGMLGMLVLSLIALVPFVGTLAVFLLMTFAAGTLVSLFYRYAFPG